jgi:ribosome-associated protein
MSQSGYEGTSWVLIDFVDVIVQIFSAQARSYYDLDGLWGDAPIVEWRR